MPGISAQLLNANGRVTTHNCVRLEIRRLRRPDRWVGYMSGIYPIYRCTETDSERIFGCMPLGTARCRLKALYPGIPLVYTDSPERQADSGLAA